VSTLYHVYNPRTSKWLMNLQNSRGEGQWTHFRDRARVLSANDVHKLHALWRPMVHCKVITTTDTPDFVHVHPWAAMQSIAQKAPA
jgi:hypothetical protein